MWMGRYWVVSQPMMKAVRIARNLTCELIDVAIYQ
jgi:hypothetical protein